jgi:hypothetical protein
MTTATRNAALTVAALAAGVALVVLDAPPLLRWPALPLLIIAPGAAAVAALYGGRDPAVRLPLSVVLGVALALLAALGVHLAGIPITATSLAVGVAALGLAATVAALVVRRRTGDARPPAGAVVTVRAGAAVLAASAVLAGAVGIAVAVQPAPRDRYTALSFLDPQQFTGPVAAAPGRDVRLNWALDAYGAQLSPALTRLQLDVDGQPVDDVAVDLSPLTTMDGADSTLTGGVTFSAPQRPGRHVVTLTVLPAAEDSDAGPLPAPGPLSTAIEVRP